MQTFTISTYRALLIVNTIFDTYCSVLAPSAKYMISFAVITCMAAAIRLPGDDFLEVVVRFGLLSLGGYFLVLLLLGASASSGVWAKSSNAREQYRNHGAEGESRKYVRQVADSLGPIRFGVAGLYYMEKNAETTFLNSLVDGTLSMLITFK